MHKTSAVASSEECEHRYIRLIAGAPMLQIARGCGMKRQSSGNSFRLINGNVLSGVQTDGDGSVNVYQNQVTIISEGDKYEMLGWMMPRFKKFSVARTYFSWLFPKRKYDLDTNLNGGVRAFVLSDIYDKYLPMDIYALYLIKACMAGDIDKMENLGIYEVLPEVFALCEFVDPSKQEIQQIISNGIDLMIKELS